MLYKVKISQIDIQTPIVIIGAGMIARALIIVLKRKDKISIACCAVTNTDQNVREVEGVQVLSLKEAINKYPKSDYYLAVKECSTIQLQKYAGSLGITTLHQVDEAEIGKSMAAIWAHMDDRRKCFDSILASNELSEEEKLIFYSKQMRHDGISVEITVSEHCNLNCQCCNHFAPLAKSHNVSVETIQNDLERLKMITEGRIGRLMLLGGEPLLNPKIDEILIAARSVLPTQAIYLCTNGTLLPRMSENFWDICRSSHVGIKVTRYPINFDYDWWQEYAEECGVELSDENPEPIKTTYRLPLIERGKLDGVKNYAKCYHANQCVVLRDGRIYPCPISAWIDKLNEYFGTSFPQVMDNSHSIYDCNSLDELREFLNMPIALCSYCDVCNYEYNIPWDRSKRNMTEWIEEKH